jgi:hypothetical protein
MINFGGKTGLACLIGNQTAAQNKGVSAVAVQQTGAG